MTKGHLLLLSAAACIVCCASAAAAAAASQDFSFIDTFDVGCDVEGTYEVRAHDHCAPDPSPITPPRSRVATQKRRREREGETLTRRRVSQSPETRTEYVHSA